MYVQREVGIDEERNGENQLQGGGIPLIAYKFFKSPILFSITWD